ncbi:Hypothetical_protein [Hexamita inflata]|uniref:Hypothetical_protein n=1 Tax=Hexamita inflata TaxID=28002 RepID=A0ABP1GD91_9EUKA
MRYFKCVSEGKAYTKRKYHEDFRNGRRGMRQNLLKEMICKLHMNDNGFISTISMWKQFHKTVFVINFRNWIPELVFEQDLHLGHFFLLGYSKITSIYLFIAFGCIVGLLLLSESCYQNPGTVQCKLFALFSFSRKSWLKPENWSSLKINPGFQQPYQKLLSCKLQFIIYSYFSNLLLL